MKNILEDKYIKDKFLEILDKDNIVENADMADYTSFKAGGKADMLVFPDSKEELTEVLKLLNDEGINYLILGNGSNILVRDKGFRGVIVKIGSAMAEIRVEDAEVYAEAGALLSTVSKKAMEASLTGLEFAGGIPGSIGGAAFMNAGAYGGEMKNVIKEVELISSDGKEIFNRTSEEMEYGYRHSLLYDTKDVVLSVKMQLKKGNQGEIKERMRELLARRNSKQPVNYSSAGSFFKRPAGYYAGKLIEDSGPKGARVGDAQVSMLHGGFIINLGKATATDIITLMHLVQGRVLAEFGVELEPEVRIIGEE